MVCHNTLTSCSRVAACLAPFLLTHLAGVVTLNIVGGEVHHHIDAKSLERLSCTQGTFIESFRQNREIFFFRYPRQGRAQTFGAWVENLCLSYREIKSTQTGRFNGVRICSWRYVGSKHFFRDEPKVPKTVCSAINILPPHHLVQVGANRDSVDYSNWHVTTAML